MPRPTEPVCYADYLIVWATGDKIPDLQDSINIYIEEITAYSKDNSLLISAPKSSVTLFIPDTHQTQNHARILIEDSLLPLVQCPKILGVYLDTSLLFNKQSAYVAEGGYPTETISSMPWQVYPVEIQSSWETDHQLCCTCLEYKTTRHKLLKHPIYTERSSEDCHWLSQDVQ